MSCQTDLSQIPVSVLKKQSLNILSTGLNSTKVIPTVDGLPRDWRGLAHLVGLNGVQTTKLSSSPDPFLCLVTDFQQLNLEKLKEYLEIIDRYDVLSDVKTSLDNDAREYLECLNSAEPVKNQAVLSSETDPLILTRDDVLRLKSGLEPQTYDGFLLFADEDIDFAKQIIEKMEEGYGLKLCVCERDLVGGVTFQHDAIMKLIAERSRRLIVVVSENFLKSKMNKYFYTFAQAIGIDQRQRKVVPILYGQCKLPPELSYCFLLDYNRPSKLWNFWDRLYDSIQSPDVSRSNKSTSSAAGVKDEQTGLWISTTDFSEGEGAVGAGTGVAPGAGMEETPGAGKRSVMSGGKKSKINKLTSMFKSKLKLNEAGVVEREKKLGKSSKLLKKKKEALLAA